MSVIEPIRHEVENTKIVKKHSAGLRLWHWVNTLVITGSLITVLINSTLFKDHSGTTTRSGALLKDLGDKVWGIHIYFGYALAVLFLFRLSQEFFQRKDQKFWYKLTADYRDYFVTKKNTKLAKHDLVVKILYIIFYMLLGIMVMTGLTLAFSQELNIPTHLTHTIKEFHGFCMYLIILFVAVHVAGVIMAEKNNSKGIVSDMINGGEKG